MWSTPPKYLVKGDYKFTLKVPKGTTKNFHEKLKQQNPLPKPPVTTYKVRRGDTMGGIAKRMRVSLSSLRRANPTLNPKRLQINQSIKIPKK